MRVSSVPQSPNEIHIHYWQSLGAELVWIQDRAAHCFSFFWQDAEKFNVDTTQIVDDSLLLLLDPGDHARFQNITNRVLDCRIPELGYFPFLVLGQELRLELSFSPILLPNQEAEKLLVVARQVSTTENGQQAFVNPPDCPDPYQKVLTSIARKIRSTLDLVVIQQQAVTGLGKALKVSRCLLLSYDASRLKFKVEAEYRHADVPSYLGTQWQSPDDSILNEALQSRQILKVDALAPELNDSQSALVVATLYQNRVNGLICLQQCDRPRLWREDEEELTQELAEQLGTAIAHATLYHELEEANHAAREASRLKSDFLASTTHELRTPLNGIIGFLKLILDEMADDREEELEFVEESYHSALHLLDLINDILDIAKIESGKIELNLEPVSLSQLLNEVEKFARPQTELKNLTLEIFVPDTYDDIILYSNYQRTYQILLNLVGNALKFTHEGGIKIGVEIVLKDVEKHDQIFPGMVRISVVDTGIGVALDMQEKLFKSFSQVTGGHTRKYGGTGLGLAISQKLVAALGGKISFYSMGDGLGSTVTFSIPMHQKPILKNRPIDDPQVIA